jgi:hypothetical protein
VTVSWLVDDPESGIAAQAGCGRTVVTAETAGATITCTARNRIGLVNTQAVVVRIDKTPPVVAANPSRSPDRNGWYNHPLTVAFTGTDATSGIASCTSAGYGGPDSAAAVLSGSCTDKAGNAASGSFSLKYDATPPGKVSRLRVTAADHGARLRWQRPADADFTGVVIVRAAPRGSTGKAAERLVYAGGGSRFRDRRLRNGRRYRYRVASVDRAGNRSVAVVAAVVPRKIYLLAPRQDARLRLPPMLRWLPRATARYYNVQLLRRGAKLLSAWPSRPRLALRARWRYRGRRYRLRPGTYRWFVWPGLGSRSRARYGPLLGAGTFVVVERKRPRS